VSGARDWFAAAARIAGRPLTSGPGLWEAEFALMRGDVVRARRQTQANREVLKRSGNLRLFALCDALLGHSVVRESPSAAEGYLRSARDFGSRSGEVQIQLRCYHLAT